MKESAPKEVVDFINEKIEQGWTLGQVAEYFYYTMELKSTWSNFPYPVKWGRLNFTLFAKIWIDKLKRGNGMDTEKVQIKYVALFESINMVSLTLDNSDHLILSTNEFNRITLSVDHETVLSKKGFTYLPTYIGNEQRRPVFDGFQIIKLPLSEPLKGGV